MFIANRNTAEGGEPLLVGRHGVDQHRGGGRPVDLRRHADETDHRDDGRERSEERHDRRQPGGGHGGQHDGPSPADLVGEVATDGVAEHVAQTGHAQHEPRGTGGIAAPGQVEHDEHGQEVADPVDQDAETDDPHPAGQAAQRVAESRLVDARPVRRRGAHATGSVRTWIAAASRLPWAIASVAVAPRAMT